MAKNIVIGVLVILLFAGVAWGWLSLQAKNKLQDKIVVLESEKVALQNKIGKGLVYAEALDLLYEPIRKQMGVPTRQNLSDADWLLKLTEATSATADNKLQGNLDDIKKGGNTASASTVLFMEYSASAIVDSLK